MATTPPALFIFGAGATRGCSFVNSSINPCLPPLDRDFFAQLRSVHDNKHRQIATKTFESIGKLMGIAPGGEISTGFEQVFTTVEQGIHILKVRTSKQKFEKGLQETKVNLRQALAAVMEAALVKDAGNGRFEREGQECEYHTNFVKNALTAKDSIISFNYDCVLDETLKRHGDGKWNARYGYDFDSGRNQGSGLFEGDVLWNPSNPANKDDTVNLYKLHGSLHFRKKDDKIALKKRPYKMAKDQPSFFIIPPGWGKKIGKDGLATLWRRAADAVVRAKHIVVIGYSFPQTDIHAVAFFNAMLVNNRLKSLVIVNPDETARSRCLEVFRKGISSKTRILFYPKFRDFARVSDHGIWRKS